MSQSINLYPLPRSFHLQEGSSVFSPNLKFRAGDEQAQWLAASANVEHRCQYAVNGHSTIENTLSAETIIEIIYLDSVHPQGYKLSWSSNGLTISASAEIGMHYALVTFEQLMKRQGLAWAHCCIEDEPDFPVRGVMLDIGRNKIPKMETIYSLIDRMSELKLNHLQLYMEGFCFEYEKYKDSFPDATPITATEYKQIDAYARSRYIDLVPNQNCLGHMANWLANPEFRELAEHPNGMPTPIGFTIPPTTLNPIDERSVQFAKSLFDELLPNFSSEYANINLDEPFGLGTGQSKPRADEVGIGRLYLEYAEKMSEIVRTHGKRTLMWGDIIFKHPELIPMLPKDVTVLDWNYESRVSFKEHCELLQASNIPYYVCPGTSAWSSITGRTNNMLQNIADAARNGKVYGAKGLIVTDWGDNGHWQTMPFSYPGIAYAAGTSWQTDTNVDCVEQLENFLNEVIFQDGSGLIGNLLLELGQYYLLENSSLENRTYTNFLLTRGVTSHEKLEFESQLAMKIQQAFGSPGGPFQLDYQFDTMQVWLEQRKNQLSQLRLDTSDAPIVRDELENAIRLIEHGIGLHQLIHCIHLPDEQNETIQVAQLRSQLEIAMNEFKRIWLERNREGGLSESTKPFTNLLVQYDEKLKGLSE